MGEEVSSKACWGCSFERKTKEKKKNNEVEKKSRMWKNSKLAELKLKKIEGVCPSLFYNSNAANF